MPSMGDTTHLLDAFPSRIAVLDGTGRIVAVNRSWREADPLVDTRTGPVIDLLFPGWDPTWRPERTMAQTVERAVADILAGRQSEYIREYRAPRGGEETWNLFRLAAHAAGEQRGLLVVHVDITERRRAERYSAIQQAVLERVVGGEPLRDTLRLLAGMIDAETGRFRTAILCREPRTGVVGHIHGASLSQIAFAEFDRRVASGTPSPHDPALTAGTPVVVPDLPRHAGWSSFLDCAEQAGIAAAWTTAIRTSIGVPVAGFVCYYPHADQPNRGDELLRALAAPLAAIAIERALSSRAIAEADQRYRSVFALHPDAVFTLDGSGLLQTANPVSERLFGAIARELRGRRFTDWVEPSSREETERRLHKAIAGTPQRFRTTVTDHARRAVTLDMTLVPLVVEGAVEGVYGVAKDLTEQLRAEAALLESAERLRQSQKLEAVGQLAGGVAHDFNNLLTAVRGYAEVLIQDPAVPTSAHHDLTEITRAVERGATLTRQLLTFSRQQVVQVRLVEINALVEGIRSMLVRLLASDISLSVIPSPDPAWVRADPALLEQMLLNLVVNASDAMPDGGQVVVEVGRTRAGNGPPFLPLPAGPDDWVTLTVRDTGRGMPPDVQARIFEPFFTTKPPGQGTGLGLSTVYGIVEQSGGQIGFRSAVGQGSIFAVALPATAAGEPAAPSRPEPKVAAGTEVILLVEDEEAVREMVHRLLAAAGYTVLVARHGQDAVLVADQYAGPIDLLLTDVIMPELHGPQLAKALRATRPTLRVVYMSGYTRNEIDRRGLVEIGAAFLPKPFSVAHLSRTIREVLDGRETEHGGE